MLLLRAIVGFAAIVQKVPVPFEGRKVERWRAASRRASGHQRHLPGDWVSHPYRQYFGWCRVCGEQYFVASYPCDYFLFDGQLVSLEMIVMAVSIAMLGPGAFALDARLFGRREIVIPPVPRDPEV